MSGYQLTYAASTLRGVPLHQSPVAVEEERNFLEIDEWETLVASLVFGACSRMSTIGRDSKTM